MHGFFLIITCYLERRHLNHSVDIRYTIAGFNMSLLTVKLQLGLTCRNVWISWFLPWDKIWTLIFLILFKKVCLRVWKLEQWRKKCVAVSGSSPQSQNVFWVLWKQCLNLWSRGQLRPRRNLVRTLIPYGLWILKILLAQDCIKFSRFLVKIESFPEVLISQSKLFHLDRVEGKNESLK